MDGSASDKPRPPRRLAWFAAIGVLVAAVASSAWLLGGRPRALARVPAPAAEQAAAQLVAAGWQEGDVVRIDPYWYTGPRLLLARALPGVSFPWLSFDLRGHPDPLHLLRYRRLWVIAGYDALARDAAEDAAFVGLPLVPIERVDDLGDLRVSLYELPQSPIRYDLLHRLGDAVVRRGDRPCRWDRTDLRQRCGEQGWKDVFVAVKEVGDATRQVVYAEPHPANTVLRIRYPDVALDGALVLHTGMSIEGARRTAGADVRVRLLVDDEVVHDWIEPRNAFEWRRTVVPGDGGVHDVTIEISAPEVGWRQLCYDGAVVSPEAVALLGLTAGQTPAAPPADRR